MSHLYLQNLQRANPQFQYSRMKRDIKSTGLREERYYVISLIRTVHQLITCMAAFNKALCVFYSSSFCFHFMLCLYKKQKMRTLRRCLIPGVQGIGLSQSLAVFASQHVWSEYTLSETCVVWSSVVLRAPPLLPSCAINASTTTEFIPARRPETCSL